MDIIIIIIIIIMKSLRVSAKNTTAARGSQENPWQWQAVTARDQQERNSTKVCTEVNERYRRGHGHSY
eukprot:2177164-Amphidinium_carterae.1